MQSVQKRKNKQRLNIALLCMLFALVGCLITVLIIQANKDDKENNSTQENQIIQPQKVQEDSSAEKEESLSWEKGEERKEPFGQKNSAEEVEKEAEPVMPSANPTFDRGGPKNYTEEYIDAKVEEIKTYYYATQEHLSSLKAEDTGRYKYYRNNSGKVEKVDFIMNGIGYYASYYYHNEKLYFAFIWMGSRENRFYIEDGKILRWIDTEKNVVDITAPNKNYYWWDDLIFGKNDLKVS